MEKYIRMTLKKEWFDKILSGEKTVEYREYKPYWIKRIGMTSFKDYKNALLNYDPFPILFINGYRKDSRKMVADIIKIELLKPGAYNDLGLKNGIVAIYLENVKEITGGSHADK